jgi:hypothetical protein
MEKYSNIELLTQKIKLLEHELEVEFTKQRAGLNFSIEQGRIRFEEVLAYIVKANPLIVLTAPLIYMLIIPFALLDLCISIYQAICFPVYKIQKVKRSEYFIFDRTHLVYLNSLQKINCAYCSYANGLIAYVREIGGRTEQYWCPIKHARRVVNAHEQYAAFCEFGDADAFQKITTEVHS